MQFSHRSNHRRKAVAKSSLAMVRMTPSQVVLKLSEVKVVPTSCILTLVNKKKSAGARSGKKRENLMTLRLFAAVWTWMMIENFATHLWDFWMRYWTSRRTFKGFKLDTSFNIQLIRQRIGKFFKLAAAKLAAKVCVFFLSDFCLSGVFLPAKNCPKIVKIADSVKLFMLYKLTKIAEFLRSHLPP